MNATIPENISRNRLRIDVAFRVETSGDVFDVEFKEKFTAGCKTARTRTTAAICSSS